MSPGMKLEGPGQAIPAVSAPSSECINCINAEKRYAQIRAEIGTFFSKRV